MPDTYDVCQVCGEKFTGEEWDRRHTLLDDGISDIHSRCCAQCHPPGGLLEELRQAEYLLGEDM